MKAIVVIPAYKAHLSHAEAASLRQAVSVLGPRHDISLLCPHGLDTTEYGDIPAYRVNDRLFTDRKAYSRLCEHPDLYRHYLDAGYDYMLLYQLDAWVFADRLDEFCVLGYDYIGAPHCGWMPQGLIVGNGGLSLRKLRRFVWLCQRADFSTTRWEEDRAFTEGRLARYFDIAPLDVAFRFSIQDHYDEGMESNNGELPFGSHQLGRHWPWDALKAHAPALLDAILKDNES